MPAPVIRQKTHSSAFTRYTDNYTRVLYLNHPTNPELNYANNRDPVSGRVIFPWVSCSDWYAKSVYVTPIGGDIHVGIEVPLIPANVPQPADASDNGWLLITKTLYVPSGLHLQSDGSPWRLSFQDAFGQMRAVLEYPVTADVVVVNYVLQT